MHRKVTLFSHICQNMCQTTKIELLSPARDVAVGKAAIAAGADAVYIGAPRFSARQAAGNSLNDIAELCRYAHQYEAKVLVALNTLLTNEELKEAVEIVWQLHEIGVDALIVQDMNLLNMPLPDIRLHASTQCDNRSIEDVIAREKAGFKRAVLARELSLEEIKAIRKASSIELEAFVHGALCVSYSGRCYLSEALMNRSANRGMCAQMCRQQYNLLDKDKNEILHGKYLLSLRDLDRSRYLQQMLDAGITTLKIEGRLKDENYVRNITGYYRLLLDKIFAASDGKYEKSSKGNTYLGFTPNPEKTFHRSETDYFLNGRTDEMANFDSPKSTGEYIGKLTEIDYRHNTISINFASDARLNNGDGLTVNGNGFGVNGTNGNTIIANRLPENLSVGAWVFRNYDKQFYNRLEHAATRRTIPVNIILSETEDGFSLQIGNQKKCFAYKKEPALNKERAELSAKSQLSKLGDTIYEALSVNIVWKQPYFIPASTLNSWRREVVLMLQADTKNESINACPDVSAPTLKASYPMPLPKELMTCKYCILHELDMCRKKVHKTSVPEPKYLLTGKHLLELHFDCHKCLMTITKAD